MLNKYHKIACQEPLQRKMVIRVCSVIQRISNSSVAKMMFILFLP